MNDRRHLARLIVAAAALFVDVGCPAPDEPPPPPTSTCAPQSFGPDESDAARGVLVVVGGEGGAGYIDGRSGRTNGVGGLAPRSDGSVVVSDIFNGTLRLMAADGSMQTVAGFPLDVGAVDGGCGEARLGGPRGIVVDPQDDDVVLFGDGPCLRSANLKTGDVVTLAGDCDVPGDDDGPVADARFGFLFHDIEAADDGRVFVADRVNDAIRVIDREGGFTITLATGFDGPGGMALVEAGGSGTLFIADTFSHAVRAVNIDSGAVSVVAGVVGSAGSVDGTGSQARLDSPQALALVDDDTLLVAGFDGDVRRIVLSSGEVSTIATGLGGFFASFAVRDGKALGADLEGAIVSVSIDGNGNGDVDVIGGPAVVSGYVDGPAAISRFTLPASVVISPDGERALVSDSFNGAIRAVSLGDGQTSTFLGGTPGVVDGAFDVAQFDFPAGLALAGAGNTLYVADTGAGAIRVVDFVGETVSTLATMSDPWELAVDEDAGVVVVSSSAEGEVVALDIDSGDVVARVGGFNLPVGVVIVDGRVFVSDNEDHTISELDLDAETSAVVLGTSGFQGSADGDAAVALLSFPAGLDARVEDGVGVLYVAETGGQVIRRITIDTMESRFVVGDPFLSGALPAGARVELDGAPLLNPNDVAVVADDIVIAGETQVLVARP